jgi:hypothetical protein
MNTAQVNQTKEGTLASQFEVKATKNLVQRWRWLTNDVVGNW